MWQILLGFAGGVYVGTIYDCKPLIASIKCMVDDKLPKKKE
jgi:hypothetical protein